MLVKCKACSNKIDRDVAHKVTLSGKNNYYCNEKEYLDLEKEKCSRLKAIEISKQIIGQTTNTALYKELSDIAKIYSYVKIFIYLSENISEINKHMNKSFSKEFAKIKYFSAIIKNSIGDYVIRDDRSEENYTNIEIVNAKYKAKDRKKNLNQYMDEYLKGE